MGLMHAGLLLLLLCSACSNRFKSAVGYGPFVEDPDLEWARMEKLIGEEMKAVPSPKSTFMRSASASGSSTPGAKRFPEYVRVSASQYPKEALKPEKGVRPLPDKVQSMLLGPPSISGNNAATQKLVEILCHVDRMYVRISRKVFKSRDAYKYLKLGTCPVNQGTKDHYYLLYLLKTNCGFNRESNADYLSISNVLHYKPSGQVLREMPFDIPLRCKYHRWFHSYKVGFHPKLLGGSVLKALQPQSSYILTAVDASGNDITGSQAYILGQPMYFVAKSPDTTALSGDQRMYIHKCYATANQDQSSSLRYTVIDNYGCMVDSKVSDQSKFLSGPSKMEQRFSVGAFIFRDTVSTSSSSQKLYMYCELEQRALTPTPSAKACNYDPATKKWKELYGADSVCTCCESTCSSTQMKASSNIVSSRSWEIDLSGKEGSVEVWPQMKSLDADSFSLEDPDMAEHKDFLNYWEHDY